MSANECWFCATPTRNGEYLHFGMHRDVRYTPLVIALHTRWATTTAYVPRCERCMSGHVIEKWTRWIFAGSALVTGLPTVLMLGSNLSGEPWADQWQIIFPWIWTLSWLVLWLGVRQHWFGWHRLAPRPERHARRHPAVVRLAEDGWKYGGGPPGS
ncbi:hypothetical protein [Marinactinospora rubrisoli]|uniref:Uncharacterized protein n=1 Tax=Marinactinospora rubrisoli TaxID=2715399 RepID=A0ABW2KFS0_9ACTN